MLFCKFHSQQQDQGQRIYTCISDSCSLKFQLFCGYCGAYDSIHSESSCRFIHLKTKVDLFQQMNYLQEFQNIWNDLKGNIIKYIDHDTLMQKIKEKQEIAEQSQAKQLSKVNSQLLRKLQNDTIENEDTSAATVAVVINHSQNKQSCQQFEDKLQDVRIKLDNQYFLINVMEKNKKSYPCVSQNLREINTDQKHLENQPSPAIFQKEKLQPLILPKYFNSAQEVKINSKILTEDQSSVSAPKSQQKDKILSLEILITEFNTSLSILNRYLKWLKDLEQQFLKNLCSWYWRLHGLEISHVNKETIELRSHLRNHSVIRITLQEISKHFDQLQQVLCKEQDQFIDKARLIRKSENGKSDKCLDTQKLNQTKLSLSPYLSRNLFCDMLQTLPAHFTNILRCLRSIQINERYEFKNRNTQEQHKERNESILNYSLLQFPSKERQSKEFPASKYKNNIFTVLPACSSSSSNYLPSYLKKWSFDGQVLITVSQSASSANTQIIKIMQIPQQSKEQPSFIVNNIAFLENIETLQIASKRIIDVSLSNTEEFLGVSLAEGYLFLIKRSPKSINLNESINKNISQDLIEINNISANIANIIDNQQLLQQETEAEISPTNCNRIACKLKGNYKKIEFMLSRNLLCCLSVGSSSDCLIFDYLQNCPVIQISMMTLCKLQEGHLSLDEQTMQQQDNQKRNPNEFRDMRIYNGLIYPSVILQTNTSVSRINLTILPSSQHRINQQRIIYEEEFQLAIPSPDESYLLLLNQKSITLKYRNVQKNTNNINDQDIVDSSTWQLKWQYSQDQKYQAKQFEFSNDSSELYILYDHSLVLLHIKFLHYYKSNDKNYTEFNETKSMDNNNNQYLTELFYDKSIKLQNFFLSADNSLIHIITDIESIITLRKTNRPKMF